MTPPAHIGGRQSRAREAAGLRHDESGDLARRTAYAVVILMSLAAVGAYAGLIPAWSPPPLKQRTVVVGPPPAEPGLDLEAAPTPTPALVLATAPHPRTLKSAVRTRLANAVGDNALGKQVGVAVARLGTAEPVWQLGNETAVTPASTLKLLTTVAALETMGPQHRFTTSVVRGSDRRSVVLVGGGDPLLTGKDRSRSGDLAPYPRPASLDALAVDTAAALTDGGVRRVRLRYDVSLFSGPAVSPDWEPSYVPESVVSPISALWVDEGRQVAGYALRVPDPAQVAAERFAAALGRHGVIVTGSVLEGAAPRQVRTVAEVKSPRLAEIVQHVLETSDNEGAEVLLRQTALVAGQRGSFKGGVAAVTRVLSGLGVDLSNATIHDGSGLARSDRLPIDVLVHVLQLAASSGQSDLRTVVSALPVAGFTGSLESRFVDSAPAGLGLVRAKTGTLTGVHGLAGLVTTVDHGVLVFAAVADRVPVVKTLDARAQLDRIAALLATCGC